MRWLYTIKGKVRGLIAVCIASLLCILGLSVITLNELDTRFTSMKESALDGRLATTAINRDINYVSRLTRNIMLGSNIEKDIASLEKRIQGIKENFVILKAGAEPGEEQRLVAQAEKAALAFVQDGLRFAKNMQALPVGDRYKQYGAYGQSATPLAMQSREYFGELTKRKDVAYDHAVSDFHADIASLKVAVMGLSGGIILLIAVLCALMQRSILRPLVEISQYTVAVAAGDYSRSIDVAKFRGELGETAASVAHMVQSLRTGMATVEEHSRIAGEQAAQAKEATQQAETERQRIATLLEMMNASAAQSADIVDDLHSETEGLREDASGIADDAESQKIRAQETATAMEEMTATIGGVAHNAALAAGNAEEAKADAENGLALIRQVIQVSDEARTQTSGLQSTLGELSQRVEGIGTIMSVISDIADQTNLLALNAAIEAARAGDAGRGFAVVADEVRKLAEKTMSATREVGDAIKGIQSGATANVQAMEQVAIAVSRNYDLTNEAGSALETITHLVGDTAVQISSIATAAEQQSAACEEVNQATLAVSDISIRTSGSIERSGERILSIAQMAAELRDVIGEMRKQAQG